MHNKTLSDILGPRPEETNTLRWQTTVPLATNPSLLVELFQLAFVSASIVLLILCIGVWVSEGNVAVADIISCLAFASTVLLGIMAGFIIISVLFFRNKYYATYHMDSFGIYHEGTRGKDERKNFLCLRLRPFPVVGNLSAGRTRSRFMSWDKIDRFQNFSSMRMILLQRGRWHMLRIYTPDTATHDNVVQYLTEKHLRQL